MFNPNFEVVEFNWNQKGTYLASITQRKPLFLISALGDLFFIALIYFFIIYGLFDFQSITDFKKLLWVHLALIFLLVYIANMGSLAGDQGRYRVVIMPLLFIYAAAGLTKFLNAISSPLLHRLTQTIRKI